MRPAVLTFLLAGLAASAALALTTDEYLVHLALFAGLLVCLSVLTLGSVMPGVRADGTGRSAAEPDPVA